MPSPIGDFFGLAAVGAVVGAGITTGLQIYLDAAERKRGEREAIRDLIARLDEAFRTQKHIKRQLRSRNAGALSSVPAASASTPGDKPGKLVKPRDYLIPMGFFVERMDELSRLQLTLEEVRQIIRSRVDLFSEDQIERLMRLIAYAEKYLHGVIDEYEECGLRDEEGDCLIDDRRPRIADFLRGRWKTDLSEMLAKAYRATSDPEASDVVVKQLIAEAERDFGWTPGQGPRPRTKMVSDICLRAALWEMREQLVSKSRPLWLRGEPRKPQADIDEDDEDGPPPVAAFQASD